MTNERTFNDTDRTIFIGKLFCDFSMSIARVFLEVTITQHMSESNP